ncbi:hypothetical protein ACWF62_17600 [Rhodococcus sp. NPDC054953]
MNVSATDLAAALATVTPHAGRPWPTINIERTTDTLYLAASDGRTVAVARIPHLPAAPGWARHISVYSATSVTSWLDDLVTVTVTLNAVPATGTEAITFTSGHAVMHLGCIKADADLPWRRAIGDALRSHAAVGRREVLALNTALLARWESAGRDLEVIPGPAGAPMILRGPDVIGMQMPMTASGDDAVTTAAATADAWADALFTATTR